MIDDLAELSDTDKQNIEQDAKKLLEALDNDD